MMSERRSLNGRRITVLAADGFEKVEHEEEAPITRPVTCTPRPSLRTPVALGALAARYVMSNRRRLLP